MIGGGIVGIEFGVAAAYVAIPVVAAEVPAAAAGGGGLLEILLAGYHTFELSGRFVVGTAPFGGLYLYGVLKATEALNQYDRDVADCNAKYGYPNVP